MTIDHIPLLCPLLSSKHIVQEIILSLRTSTGIISHAPTNLAQALRKAFLNSDRHFKNQAEFKQQTDEMGSTGLVVLLTDAHVVVGNVGDTRCIISTKTSVVRSLSIDHKPSEEMEKQRIVHAGGFVLRNRVSLRIVLYLVMRLISIPLYDRFAEPWPFHVVLETIVSKKMTISKIMSSKLQPNRAS